MDPPPQASNSRFTPEFASRVPSPFTETKEVKNVWCYNLDNEMNEIMKAATQYAYVGMVGPFRLVLRKGYGVPWYLLFHEGPAGEHVRLQHDSQQRELLEDHPAGNHLLHGGR